MSELVFNHVLLFNFLLHHHLVYLLLPNASLSGLLVTHLKTKRLGNCYTVPASALALYAQLMHIIVSSNSFVV